MDHDVAIRIEQNGRIWVWAGSQEDATAHIIMSNGVQRNLESSNVKRGEPARLQKVFAVDTLEMFRAHVAYEAK